MRRAWCRGGRRWCITPRTSSGKRRPTGRCPTWPGRRELTLPPSPGSLTSQVDTKHMHGFLSLEIHIDFVDRDLLIEAYSQCTSHTSHKSTH